jgi:hypothetical protein
MNINLPTDFSDGNDVGRSNDGINCQGSFPELD